MASGKDQAVGYGMMTFAAAVFSYYTIWVIILPFVDEEHLLQQFFLPRAYAVVIPIAAGVLALMGIAAFAGMIIMKSKKPKTS